MRANNYSEDLVDMLKWMLTFEEHDRPNFNLLWQKIGELHTQGKWRRTKVPIEKTPKVGSK